MEKREEEKQESLSKFLKGGIKNKFVSSLFKQNVKAECAERVGVFLKALNQQKIKIGLFKSYAFRGIPGECVGLRGIVWKILLNYLPPETAKWGSFMEEQLNSFNNLKAEFVMPEIPKIIPGNVRILSPDEELTKEIKTDIKRTKNDIPFFRRPFSLEDPQTPTISLETQAEEKKEPNYSSEEDAFDFINNQQETHKQVISRLLFLYSKIHSNIGYVQGMNEIIAVIYYCFYYDSVPEMKKYFVSDTFYCFELLMKEIEDRYNRKKDNTETGINGTIGSIGEILKKVDPDYSNFLTESRADIQLFALRWVMMLLAQDMKIHNVIRLWDTLFGDQERFLFFQYIMVQFVLEAKNEVLGKEFFDFIKIIQKMPEKIDLLVTLKKAGEMLAKDLKKDNYNGEHY